MKDLSHHRRHVQKKAIKSSKKEQTPNSPVIRPKKEQAPKMLKSKKINKRSM